MHIEKRYIERIEEFTNIILEATKVQGFETVDEYIKYFSFANKYKYMVYIETDGRTKKVQIDYTFNKLINYVCSIRRLDPVLELKTYIANTNKLFGNLDENVIDELMEIYEQISILVSLSSCHNVHKDLLELQKFDFSRINNMTKVQTMFITNMVRKRNNTPHFRLANMFICLATNTQYTDVEDFYISEILGKKVRKRETRIFLTNK